MSKQLRKSGIEILGDVPWGTHFCQFYHTDEELADILVPYLKRGLEEAAQRFGPHHSVVVHCPGSG
jgi:hypothetical protein